MWLVRLFCHTGFHSLASEGEACSAVIGPCLEPGAQSGPGDPWFRLLPDGWSFLFGSTVSVRSCLEGHVCVCVCVCVDGRGVVLGLSLPAARVCPAPGPMTSPSHPYSRGHCGHNSLLGVLRMRGELVKTSGRVPVCGRVWLNKPLSVNRKSALFSKGHDGFQTPAQHFL